MDILCNIDDVLIFKIIDYLPFKDILSLKKVNKRLCQVVSDYTIDSLIISQCKMPLNQRWFHSNQLVDYSNQIKTNNYSILNFNHLIFNKIKRLLIISPDYSNFVNYNLIKLFQQINTFMQLENLELIGLKMEITNQVELDLLTLKTLNIDRVELGKIIIKAPNLASIRIEQFEPFENKLVFVYPQSIESLVTNYYEKYITTFVNLKYLYVGQRLYLRDLISIDESSGRECDDFLTKLTSLKEIQFYTEQHAYNYLIIQKDILKRLDLKIYYCGCNLIDNDLDRLPSTDKSPYFYLDSKSFQFYTHYYFQTARLLPFAKRLGDYNKVASLIDLVPEGLINKFVNLKTIEIKGKVMNSDRLIEFLRCFNHMKALEFENSGLDQSFFDQLPKIQTVLDQLKIIERTNLDYTFIKEFSNLNYIFIDESLEFDLVCDAFLKFQNLKFYFFIHEIEVSMNVEYDRFEFCAADKEIKFKDAEQLFEYFALVDFDNQNLFENLYGSDVDEYLEDLDEEYLDDDLDEKMIGLSDECVSDDANMV